MAEFDNSARPLQQKKTTALPPRLQSYAEQSLAELTEKLVKVSKEEKGQSLSSRTRDIVYVLKVHKLRHSANAHVFLGGRGVESLLSLLSLCSGQEGRDRGLLLATLANLCSLHGDCRSKVTCRAGWEWLPLNCVVFFLTRWLDMASLILVGGIIYAVTLYVYSKCTKFLVHALANQRCL